MDSEARIQKIQIEVAVERSNVSKLEALVKSRYYDEKLRHIRTLLDDAERSIGYAHKNHVGRWIEAAEMVFAIAVHHRRGVQEVIEKYGPDMDAIGK